MKNLFLLIISFLFVSQIFAQVEPINMSDTAKTQFQIALEIDSIAEAVLETLTDSGTYYNSAQVDSRADRMMATYEALGSTVKALPFNWYFPITATTHSIVDSRFIVVELTILDTMPLTGVGWGQYTQGVYTADNYNGFSLYSWSNNTHTKVAETTNDGNIWKAASLSSNTKAFITPYTAYPGIYYIGLSYNSSAETTAPTLYFLDITSRANALTGTTNRLCATIDAITSLPATFANTDYTGSVEVPSLWVY